MSTYKPNVELNAVETTLIAAVRGAVAGKLRGKNLMLAQKIINDSIENAHDTINEGSRPREEWAEMFWVTACGCLCDENVYRHDERGNPRVAEVFKSIGIEG